MKGKKHFSRIISLILTLSLLLGLLPMSALALGARGERPDAVTFKTMRLDSIRNVRNIANYQYHSQTNSFIAATDLNNPNTWLQLTYTIEKSQYVSLELYELDSGDMETAEQI